VPPPGSNPPTHAATVPSPRAALDRELGGDLRCVACGYNLRGLSIRGQCPECGVGVRATILAIVDPHAKELQPIHRKKLVAAGLVLWAGGAAGAALIASIPVVLELARSAGAPAWRVNVGAIVLALLACSGVGAIALVRPHGGLRLSMKLATVFAIALHVPLLWLGWTAWTEHLCWVGGGAPSAAYRYFHSWSPTQSQTIVGVAFFLTIAAILFCLRPVVRVLVARSLVMRSGRVDRQTMYAMAGAAVLAAIGHAVGYLGTRLDPGVWGPLVRSAALVLLSLGSLLLVIGLCGGLIDAVRIAKAVLLPSPSIREVIRGGPGLLSPSSPGSRG
jgi:hypothetical protein